MLAAEIIRCGAEPSEILSDPLNFQLIESIARFSKLLERAGIKTRIASGMALSRLPFVSDLKKLDLIRHYEQSNAWLEPLLETNIEKEVGIDELFLKKALETFGLETCNEFWKVYEKDHLVEVYGSDMVQLCRSLNFFSITGYSILDLSIFEWFILYERPKVVLEQMFMYAEEVLKESIRLQKVHIPKHLLKENFNTDIDKNFSPRACLVEFLKIGTLTKSHTREPKGLIVSSRAEVVSSGNEALHIQFV